MREIIFLLEEAIEGGFNTRAHGESITLKLKTVRA